MLSMLLGSMGTSHFNAQIGRSRLFISCSITILSKCFRQLLIWALPAKHCKFSMVLAIVMPQVSLRLLLLVMRIMVQRVPRAPFGIQVMLGLQEWRLLIISEGSLIGPFLVQAIILWPRH